MFHANLVTPPSQDILVAKLYEIAAYTAAKHFSKVFIQVEGENLEFQSPEEIANFADQLSYHNSNTVH